MRLFDIRAPYGRRCRVCAMTRTSQPSRGAQQRVQAVADQLAQLVLTRQPDRLVRPPVQGHSVVPLKPSTV